MFGGALRFFAGLHYWFPDHGQDVQRVGPSGMAFFSGFNTLYFPMFILGWQGLPRRYYDYPPEFRRSMSSPQ
jgi:cytochrome c oxidase subunit 1